MKKQMLILAVLAFAAVNALAATQATGTNKVTPTLTIQATVQSAVKLTLSTGTAAIASHCAVTNPGPTTDYAMNFGTVDALAISAGNCNVFAPTTPGQTPAIYWSDYDLTPVYSGQTAAGNTITAQVTTNFNANAGLAVVRDTANSAVVPAGVGSFSAMGVASADTIGSNVTNGTALIRFIGVQVSPNNTATTVTGAQSAIVTFTLSVP